MATLDGNNNINADEVYSSVIEFSGTLNNINPTTFNYLSGTTSNIQAQLNNISSTSSLTIINSNISTL